MIGRQEDDIIHVITTKIVANDQGSHDGLGDARFIQLQCSAIDEGRPCESVAAAAAKLENAGADLDEIVADIAGGINHTRKSGICRIAYRECIGATRSKSQ